MYKEPSWKNLVVAGPKDMNDPARSLGVPWKGIQDCRITKDILQMTKDWLGVDKKEISMGGQHT